MKTQGQEEKLNSDGRGMKSGAELANGLGDILQRGMDRALGVKKRASKKCKAHGVYVASLYGEKGKERWSKCPECLVEAVDKEAREERARLQQEAMMRNGNRLISASGIPVRFAHATLDNYKLDDEPEKQAKAVKVCRSFVDNFPACLATGASMVMMGDVGTGKTHLACAMVKEISRRHGASTTYITAARMYRALKSTYGKDAEAEEQDVINEFVQRDLLVIDELGISYNSQAEKVLLFDIINGRYEINRPTVIVTNMKTKAQIEEWLTKPVYDRLTERGRAVLFDWGSHRGKVY